MNCSECYWNKTNKLKKNIQLYVFNVTVTGFSFHKVVNLQIKPSVYSWSNLIRVGRQADLLDFLSNKCSWFHLLFTIFSFYPISTSSSTSACCIMFNLLVKLDLSLISTSVFIYITFDLSWKLFNPRRPLRIWLWFLKKNVS